MATEQELRGNIRLHLERERQRLEQGIADLEAMGPKAEEHQIEDAGRGNHMADDATDTFEMERDLALRRHLDGLLGQVQRALRKLEQGTYGLCDECGAPIPSARLEALPQATLCLVCKARQERRH